MSTSEITMTFPAESRFISTARLAAASIAAELDFSVDEIEALTMGANELFAILLDLAEEADASTLAVRYVVPDTAESNGEISIIGTLPEGAIGDDFELDMLAVRILDTVVDRYEVTADSIRLVKKRTSA